MASPTYTFQDVLKSVRPSTNSTSMETKAALVLDTLSSKLWCDYDWPKTLKPLTPFYLVPGQQDYPLPLDFMGFRRNGQVVNIQNAQKSESPLILKADLNQSYIPGRVPEAFGYSSKTNTLRVFPVPTEAYGAPHYMVDLTYKPIPAKVTQDTLGNLLWTEDRYFHLWALGWSWASLVHDGADPNRINQARALLDAAVEKAMSNEANEQGSAVLAPAESLDRYGSQTIFYRG